MSDGPGPGPDDVRQFSSWQAPLPPNPSELLGSSFQKPEEVFGFYFILVLNFLGFPRSAEASRASTARWVQLGRVTGDLLLKPQKKEDFRGFDEQSLQCKGLSCEISGN